MITKKEVYEIKEVADDKVKVLAELHLVNDNKYEFHWKESYGTPKLSVRQLKLIAEGIDSLMQEKAGQLEIPGTGE